MLVVDGGRIAYDERFDLRGRGAAITRTSCRGGGELLGRLGVDDDPLNGESEP